MSLTLPHQSKIRCPPSKVFSFLCDPENYPILNPACIRNDVPSTSPSTSSLSPSSPSSNTTTTISWVAVEQPPPQFLGLYHPEIPLHITATFPTSEDGGKAGKGGESLLVHEIRPQVAGGMMRVRIEYLVRAAGKEGEEGEQESSILEDKIIITAPWYLRIFAEGPARRIQLEREGGIREGCEKLVG